MRKGTSRRTRTSTVSSRPSRRARHVGDGDDLDAPVGGPVAVGRVDAQHQLGPAATAGRPRPGRSCRSRRGCPRRARPRPRRRRRPTAARVAAQVDQVGPLARQPIGLVEQRLAGEARGVVDLGEDLDVERAVAFEAGVGLAEVRGRSRRSSGPSSTATPAFSTTGVRSPRQWPGRITRSIPGGTSRWRATQRGVIRAATEIGRTATSASNPRAGRAPRAPAAARTRPGGR